MYVYEPFNVVALIYFVVVVVYIFFIIISSVSLHFVALFQLDIGSFKQLTYCFTFSSCSCNACSLRCLSAFFFLSHSHPLQLYVCVDPWMCWTQYRYKCCLCRIFNFIFIFFIFCFVLFYFSPFDTQHNTIHTHTHFLQLQTVCPALLQFFFSLCCLFYSISVDDCYFTVTWRVHLFLCTFTCIPCRLHLMNEKNEE